MTIEREYTTKLAVDDVTIDRRDIEMLDAIERYGSMHRAADELGRSYARLQNRVVEIEGAVGQITERKRGGSGGGGTELTETARDLRRQFDRHDAALDGVARVTESVFAGTVRDRTGELATVETAVGPIVALAPEGASDVQLTVRSDAVVLTDPDETPRADGTSLRNQFRGTVARLEPGDAISRVTIDLEGEAGDSAGEPDPSEPVLEALVTNASVDRLALEPGRAITASFKATAARAIDVDADQSS
ncbi:TOBE domain-containing protein [Halopiger xanaduensis]|uniref:TOBE domain-containing protein n=1 Tax=Halopiger xanaduensis (strain DSM 18323 / JCM 14033 / SH-6) TaxID=797210 RepID=F8D526_HALXS|nr:TOBE domain-containing protein [Halopiger xanaduensis]AEH38793.1 TOBE domain-containing protein [Halopiger xanaduensis SH-6]